MKSNCKYRTRVGRKRVSVPGCHIDCLRTTKVLHFLLFHIRSILNKYINSDATNFPILSNMHGCCCTYLRGLWLEVHFRSFDFKWEWNLLKGSCPSTGVQVTKSLIQKGHKGVIKRNHIKEFNPIFVKRYEHFISGVSNPVSRDTVLKTAFTLGIYMRSPWSNQADRIISQSEHAVFTLGNISWHLYLDNWSVLSFPGSI